jgi:DNA sulfur modification protein DndB
MTARKTKLESLYLPALQCKMGNWIYYATRMCLEDVANRIKFADELHHPERYDEWIQREIRPERKEQIAQYLLEQPERFFSSLVVTVAPGYGRKAEWLDLSLLDTDLLSLENIPPLNLKSIDQTLGLLLLTGNEDLFPVDGQHRLAGIREALARDPKCKDDVVSILFVAERGQIETRRLFSTLNRHAVPVNKGERIILDEDDALAIVTRRLIYEHPLIKNRVPNPKQLSLPDADQTSFTTAYTLYKINNILCLKYDKGEKWKKDFLTGSIRPSDRDIDNIYKIVAKFWDLMSKHFPAVRAVKTPKNKAISKNRHLKGGHLLFRPVGQMAFARAVKALHTRKVDIETAFQAFARLPFELAKPPWKGVIWEPLPSPHFGRMITTFEAQNVVAGLLRYYAGYKFSHPELKKLTTSYQKVLNDSEARLPRLKV